MTDVIRWQDNGYGGLLGYVGTVEPWLFQIYTPDREAGDWILASVLPGQNRSKYGDSAAALIPEAEEMLRAFTAALGARNTGTET